MNNKQQIKEIKKEVKRLKKVQDNYLKLVDVLARNIKGLKDKVEQITNASRR